MDTVIGSLITGAGTAAPIIALMWIMLKDLKSNYADLNETVTRFQLKLAEANYDLKMDYMEKSIERSIRQLELKIDAIQKEQTLQVQKLDAAFRLIDTFKLKDEDYG